jgi:lipopolysaccharide/colanic/teichoic acid biosynthesis glycosyltransferase
MPPKPIPLSKRIFDLALTLPLLALLSPLLLLLAILVRLVHGSPVLFRQQRPGYLGKPFFIYKFRSMTDRRDASGSLLPDAQRLTRLGRFLRATSLDELPELFNVLGGEMSLVGPRPLLMQYLPRYSPEQARRHHLLPGITGWAQINGWRGETDTAEKLQRRVEHDLYYIENWSLMFDLYILWRTPIALLKTESAY